MFCFGLTANSVKDVVQIVSELHFDGNVYAEIREEKWQPVLKRFRVRFSLRCHNSKGIGARQSYSGRRTTSASWEAHGRLFDALFAAGAEKIETMPTDRRAPHPIVYTSESWRGRRSWVDWQAGSIMNPVMASEL